MAIEIEISAWMGLSGELHEFYEFSMPLKDFPALRISSERESLWFSEFFPWWGLRAREWQQCVIPAGGRSCPGASRRRRARRFQRINRCRGPL